MAPTVGRIVHYHGHSSPEAQAALVVYVANEDEVSLRIFSAIDGEYDDHRDYVPFSQDPKPGHWNWPPRA